MGRIARFVVPGLVHHVTQRGNHQQDVFLNDSDRRIYLWLLHKHAEHAGIDVLGYCLMTNHVHLIVIPRRADSLARGLGRAHNDYARWLHIRRHLTGHLWQNRFFSCVMEDRHVWEGLRYVELNPVRAGVVKVAWEWPWSSARAHVGIPAPGNMLKLGPWSERFNSGSWRESLAHGFTAAANLARLREATRCGRPFGSESFVRAMEKAGGRTLARQRRGPKGLAQSAPQR